ALSEARNTAASATSSGRPIRRSGMMSYSGLRPPMSFCPSGVPTRPEMIPFTRTVGARSAAACLVRVDRAFGDRIGRAAGAGAFARPGGNIDDAAAALGEHHFAGVLDAQKIAGEIDRQDAVPFLERGVEHAASGRLRHAVDERIDAAVA